MTPLRAFQRITAAGMEERAAHPGNSAAHPAREIAAIPAGKSAAIELAVPRRAGVLRAAIRFARDGGTPRPIPLEWSGLRGSDETWSAALPPLDAGLYFYDFLLDLADGSASLGGDGGLAPGGRCQLTAYAAPRPSSDALAGKMIYHVFVDRFFRSGKCAVRPGARLDPDWDGGTPQYAARRGDSVANDVFFGGDLWGIAEKLGHISSLGADFILLSPVFTAASNHKYDVGDYLAVDPAFGGEEALAHLAAEAKKRGIGLIFDGVFDHTGDDSVYFNKYGHFGAGGAYRSPSSPYFPWYTFRRYPDDYASWWNIPILPKIDTRNADFRRFICERVLPKWSASGVRGWRLDVADELSDEFLDDFRTALAALDSSAFVVGEVWEDASDKIAYGVRRRYLSSGQLDSVMNYPFCDAVIAYIRDGDAAFFRRTVETILRRYPPHVSRSLMNFLGTHDTPRVLTVLGGGLAEDRPNAELAADRLTPQARKRALSLTGAAFLLIGILPGALSVYYGDEAGLEGHRDPFCRRPYPWGGEDAELLALVRRLGAIRRAHPAFADGELSILSLDSRAALLARYGHGGGVLCAVNRGGSPLRLTAEREMRDLFTGATGTDFTLAAPAASYFSFSGALSPDDVRFAAP